MLLSNHEKIVFSHLKVSRQSTFSMRARFRHLRRHRHPGQNWAILEPPLPRADVICTWSLTLPELCLNSYLLMWCRCTCQKSNSKLRQPELKDSVKRLTFHLRVSSNLIYHLNPQVMISSEGLFLLPISENFHFPPDLSCTDNLRKREAFGNGGFGRRVRGGLVLLRNGKCMRARFRLYDRNEFLMTIAH